MSDAAIRNVYTIGSHSVLKNLPRPNVEMVDGHSYISIKQCILYILGCGKTPLEEYGRNDNKVENITESRIHK